MEIRMEGVVTMVHGETRTFTFMRKGYEVQGFLILYHQGYHAYLNMCCHWPVPMDLGDGDFFHAEADRIRCKTHGAGYLPDTGICDMGPCINAQLETYPVSLHGDAICDSTRLTTTHVMPLFNFIPYPTQRSPYV